MISLYIRRATPAAAATAIAILAACHSSVDVIATPVDCSQATPGPNGLTKCGASLVRGSAQTCAKKCDPKAIPTTCTTPCTTDADCASGQACTCDESGAGQCVTAGCRTNADCPAQGGAASYCLNAADASDTCTSFPAPAFGCTSAKDECHSDADCDKSGPCEWSSLGKTFQCTGQLNCGA
jgi:hypothetical protein